MFCDKFIEYRNFLMVNYLIKIIIEIYCNVMYMLNLYKYKIVMCSKLEYVRYNGKCNLIGKWQVEDFEIKYVCENVLFLLFNEFYLQFGIINIMYCECF